MKPHPQSSYSRPAGQPEFGKRTARLRTSVSPLTKELAEIEAKAQGLTVGEYVHGIVVRSVHKTSHPIKVQQIFLGGKRIK